ncbi:hypothetical protein [Desulfotruncus alcoholivorax]|uniref:hypothetical protein n=1 Tax=Desulfotruncus alcoholivorax TaxID=265477 RepID=UPI0004043A6E|nr:hypothetical protein [Desulfotruncus alcoholivorax]
MEDIYATYLELKESEFKEFYSTFNEKFLLIKEKAGNIREKSYRDLAEVFLTVLMLTAQANTAKRLAEKTIDSYFKPKI